MKMQVNFLQWQILRKLVRNDKPLSGGELRMSMNKVWKKKITPIDVLVNYGLIKVPADDEAGNPWDAEYVLTPAGKVAAEYGEYDYDTETNSAMKEQTPNDRGCGKPIVHTGSTASGTTGKTKKGRKVLAGNTSR
jgi:hypothetical protein